MITLVQIYLLIGLFTSFSILFEARWTGQKRDYRYLYERCVDVASFRNTWLMYTTILVMAGLLWPAVYYARFRDWRG